MQKRSSGGCGSFLLLLFFVFLLLRLAGATDWSWWWVTSPIWLPGALVLAGMALLAVSGVSLYKIVSAALRRQTARRGDGPRADVLEAEGSEVPVRSSERQQPLALPGTTVTPDDAGASAGTPAGGPVPTPAIELDDPSD
jgi:hypothetical protein